MRNYLLLFFVMFASALSLSAQDDASVENAVITIKTNKAVDTELTIEGYAIDSKDALTVPDFITFLRHHIAQIENQ